VLPLYFEANQGQADERVQFFARGREHTIYLSGEGAAIALRQDSRAGFQPATRASSPSPSDHGLEAHPGRLEACPTSSVRLIRMTLVGANPAPVAEPDQQLPGRVNYLLGNEPARWQQGVTTFAKVRYGQVYPGVDLVYYGNEQELEYDFLIAPGVDTSAIVLRFDGADRIEINGRGELVLHVGDSQLRQRKPAAYQTIGGVRRDVPVRYQLKDGQTVAFLPGRYDPAHPLVIDPILSYSTYIGGSKGDIGWAIAVDANGSAYVAGDTLSVFKKLPVSGMQTNSGGGTKYGGDAFIARLDFSGTNLSLGYLTYLGGSGLDAGTGIAVDGAGAAYVTGYTTSTNFPVFPVPGVLQTNISGDNVLSVYKGDIVGNFGSPYPDAFVTKLDTNGLGVYSTYLGGELSDSGVDIAVDGAGAAYIVGYTESALTFQISNRVETARCTNNICGTPDVVTNITTAPLLVAVSAVTNDLGFLKSTTNTLQSVVTTTLLSPMSSVPYYTGFPIVNALQTNNNSLASFQVIRSTSNDKPFVQPKTNVVVSIDTPADLFVSKLAADGSALIYSTYLGGERDDLGTGIAVDLMGNAVISGWSDAGLSGFPLTNAIESEVSQLHDAIVAKLDATGSALVFSTFLGGGGNDIAYDVAVDAAGSAYVAGATGSTDFPSTPGARNQGGLFASMNVGTNWSLSSSGILHTIIRTVLADPFNPGVLYAGTPRGVFRSADNAATWTARNNGLGSSRSINTLAMEPSAGTPLFAGTTLGLYRSDDGGLNWTNDTPGLGTPDVRAILFTPGSPTNLYVGTSAGVYVNTNLATNWLARNSGLSKSVRALVADPSSPTTLYAATDGGVYKSTNGGVHWRSSSSGLKTKTSRALALDPTSPETLYLGTTKGFYKSVNAATNWMLLTNGLNRPHINTLLLDTAAPSTIYAGTTNGLFKSVDAGTSWFPSQSNLTALDVSALAFAAGSSTTLYSGTRGTNFAGGTNDAFLVKFAPNGQSLAYAFTFGGDKNDEAWDVAVDAMGNAFITGQTASKNFPTAGTFTSTNAYQTNLAGKIDAFVAAFGPTGATNFFAIYLGGTKNDIGQGIALDPAGNAYIVGRTESSKYPATNSIPNSGYGDSRDAFVTKLLTMPPFLSAQIVAALDNGLFSPQIVPRLVVSWPASAPEYLLECREPSGTEWMPVTQPAVVVDGRRQVTLPASAATCMFRLRLNPFLNASMR
jgi:photosystem II stability/assembly factor-like uncharacterized protein